jgi:hypothetical protein
MQIRRDKVICRIVSLELSCSEAIPDAANAAKKREVEFDIDFIRI